MLIEGLIGLGLIMFITWAVTRSVLELMSLPEMTDEEWEIRRELAKDKEE